MNFETTSGKTLLLLALIVLSLLNKADAQTTEPVIFAFADSPAIPADFTTKVFTTRINLLPAGTNKSTIDFTSFQTAGKEFYSAAFDGFISIANIRFSVNNATNHSQESFDVVYEVTYNYTDFSAEGLNDSLVLDRIGSFNAVKTGLEASTSLKGIFNVSSNSTFDFSGNLLCPSATCFGSYVTCSESTLGISPVCQSVCFSSFSCQNNGACVQKGASLPPTCSCVASSTVWYLGGHCEYRVELWMIIVFLFGFIGLIFLIVLFGFMRCPKNSTARKSANEPSRKKQEALKSDNLSSPSQRPKHQEFFRNSTIGSDAQRLSQGTSVVPNDPVTAREYLPVTSNEKALPTSNDSIGTSPRKDSNSDPNLAITTPSSRSSLGSNDNHVRRYNSLRFPGEERGDFEEYAKLTLV